MSQELKRVFPKLPSSRKVSDDLRATISKLARDPHGTTQGSRNIRIPDQRALGHIANKTVNNINDARNLFQVLPDMDYARQIIISATISPGDLTDTQLIYSVINDDLDSNLTGPLLRELQDFYDGTYRIRKLLHPILNDVLFEKGSYPLLTIPESGIDSIINGPQNKKSSLESSVVSLESFLQSETNSAGVYRPYGILGFPNGAGGKGASFESFAASDEYVKHSYVSFSSLESHDDKNVSRKNAINGLEMIAKKHAENIMVTDNPMILKHPMIQETKRKLMVRRIYGGKLHGRTPSRSAAAASNVVRLKDGVVSVSNEAKGGKEFGSLRDVENAFYTERRYQHIPVQPLLTKSQVGTQTFGHPVVMHLPAESVIPIHVPGNPKEHVGYFVLLDINGNPLNVTSHDNYYDDIRGQLNSNDQFSTQVLQTVRRGLEGQGTLNNEIIEEMTRIHAETVEADLLGRLRSGAMDGNYNISRTDHINQVMFSRHLKGQKTIMLYVPAELMTYIAFDYNEFGVGKSLLEDGKILGSIRAALMLSNTLASINNATGGKTIAITLDPKDENPAETVEFMLSEYAKVNSEGYARIIGQTHPLSLADQIQNHGVNVIVEGNSRYPETKFDVQRRDGTNSPIDTELEKDMRDKHWQFFGLSPEMADGVNQADFATTVVQNNLMLLKRVIQNQEKLDPFLTDFVRNYTLNSGILLDNLRAIIEENKKHLPKEFKGEDGIDEFISEFVNAVLVELPAPEVNNVQKQLDAYTQYSEGLEKVIDAYMSAEMFITDTTQGMEEIFDAVKKNVMAEFQRRWLRKRGVMSELDIFNQMEEDNSPAFNFMEINQNHMDGLVKSLQKYMKAALKATKKREAEAEEIAKLKEDIAATGGDDFGGGGDDSLDEPLDGGMDDGLGGDDELPPDDELGLDETLPDDEEPLDEEPPLDEEEEELTPDEEEPDDELPEEEEEPEGGEDLELDIPDAPKT